MVSAVRHAPAEDGWTVFTSDRYGYRLSYPTSWFRFGLSEDGLAILSFPPEQRIQGVILRDGGAMIQVVAGEAVDVDDLNAWTARDSRVVDAVLEKRELSVPKPIPHGCTQLVRTVSESQMGPSGQAIQVITSLYCLTDGGLFRLDQMNWKDDKKHSTYQDIGLRMALSLRAQK